MDKNKLHYEISGNGTENLVLLHGFMENLSIWEDMEPFLSDKFRLIKVDLLGHGKSPIISDTHTMGMMAAEVKILLDSLKIEKCHILGHSMGGYVALELAELFPDRLKSITLFFSTYYPDDDAKKEMRKKSFRIIKENFRAYVNAGVANLFNPNEKLLLADKIEKAKNIALATTPEGTLAATKGMIERTNKRKVLKHLDAKVLVLAGKHDTAVKVYSTIVHLPDKPSVKSYILDCGHNGHWERPEICAAILNRELLWNV